jgi:hypothetical protein
MVGMGRAWAWFFFAPGFVRPGLKPGPARTMPRYSENHVARKCPAAVAPVAGEVALGASPPPRGGPPSPAAAAPTSAPGAQGNLYRVLARQRLGPREGSPPPAPHPVL